MTRSRAADGASLPAALLGSSSGSEPGNVPDPEDQDTGDLPTGVDEDALDADELDTDRLVSRD